jgi:phage-related protein
MLPGDRWRHGLKAEAGEKSPPVERPLVWISTSKDDISEMPKPVKASFGYRLRRIQRGLAVDDTKPLT